MWSAGYQAGAVEACVCLSLSPVVNRPPTSFGPTFHYLSNYKAEQCWPELTHYPNVVNIQDSFLYVLWNAAALLLLPQQHLEKCAILKCYRLWTGKLCASFCLIWQLHFLSSYDNLLSWQRKPYLMRQVASRPTDHLESGLISTREMTTAAGPGHLPALLITPIFHQTSSLLLSSSLLPAKLHNPPFPVTQATDTIFHQANYLAVG